MTGHGSGSISDSEQPPRVNSQFLKSNPKTDSPSHFHPSTSSNPFTTQDKTRKKSSNSDSPPAEFVAAKAPTGESSSHPSRQNHQSNHPSPDSSTHKHHSETTIMEESQKRRERLKAMRIEAADTTVNAYTDRSLASGGLSNPLVEGESTSVSTQYFSPRFDYYTDPMAAFSGSRRDNISPQVSHGHSNMLPRPTHQNMTPGPTHLNMTPNQSYQNMTPGPTYQSMTPNQSYQPPGVNRPNQMIYQVPGAHLNQSPLGRPLEWAGRPQGHPPNARGGPGYALNYTGQPNMSIGNPSSVQEDYPYYGRGQRYHSSSYASGRGGSRYPESGRGRGRSHGNNTTPGSRMGGGRGGSHESISAEVRPDMYYRKEMVEDPWKMLPPVIWKDTCTPDSDKSWLPKSIITMKKAKVSTEVPQTSISQQSLAQYLASSFSDSTYDPVHNEPST